MNQIFNLKISSVLGIIVVLSFFVLTGCRAEAPSADIIEKAKIETRSILDSLNQDENTIIDDVELISQQFDGETGKYLITYEIASGLDSAHVVPSTATVFLEQTNENWQYRFIFGETYERNLQ